MQLMAKNEDKASPLKQFQASPDCGMMFAILVNELLKRSLWDMEIHESVIFDVDIAGFQTICIVY